MMAAPTGQTSRQTMNNLAQRRVCVAPRHSGAHHSPQRARMRERQLANLMRARPKMRGTAETQTRLAYRSRLSFIPNEISQKQHKIILNMR